MYTPVPACRLSYSMTWLSQPEQGTCLVPLNALGVYSIPFKVYAGSLAQGWRGWGWAQKWRIPCPMVKLEGAEKEGAITPSETAHKLLQGGEWHSSWKHSISTSTLASLLSAHTEQSCVMFSVTPKQCNTILKHTLTLWLSNSTRYFKRKENTCPHKTCIKILLSVLFIVYKTWKWPNAISWWKRKQNVV